MPVVAMNLAPPGLNVSSVNVNVWNEAFSTALPVKLIEIKNRDAAKSAMEINA